MSSNSGFFGRQSFLVVFDFDHTVVDCNSDEVVPHYLGLGDYLKSLMQQKENMQWTKLVDNVIAPFERAQLEEAVRKSIIMDDGMPDVFRFLIRLQQQQQQQQGKEKEEKEENDVDVTASAQIEIAVASDANILFIEKSIEHHIPFAREAISPIHSNSFHDVLDGEGTRRCRISWYEEGGHECPHCNEKCPNMCKSRIIARLLHTTRLVDPTVIFVGDGSNDFCPVLNILRPRDYMFARRGFPVHQLLSDAHSVFGGCCKVNLWTNAKELLQIFQRAMSPAERLPTLARFRDVGPREFRSVTLLKRMPQVIARTLKNNEATTTTRAKQLIYALIKAVQNNEMVAPLPGQKTVPPWLQAYAYVSEFDTVVRVLSQQQEEQHRAEDAVVAPRWGQLPWLHGEIYFYHLLSQYMLLEENSDDKDVNLSLTQWKPNLITPYTICSPIVSHDCPIATHAVMTAKGISPSQSFNPSFLAKDSSTSAADGILIQNGKKKYRDIAAGDSILPLYGYFQSYRDFFLSEKREVLHNFIVIKICPMLACVPWEADDNFVVVLLRWMLWGNGVDLSMFTLEQLHKTHNVEQEGDLNKNGTSNGLKENSNGTTDINVHALRAEELKKVMDKDNFIVGNQAHDVARLVCRIVKEESKDVTKSHTIDIVMDNVGVECVADFIFALWVLHHHPSLRVTLHVKSMPYYVSDVTPPDVAFLIQELEDCARQEPLLVTVLMPFTQLLREAFNSGRLCIDADAVWTQPCEYRELPPHVCNTFFYTQRVLSEAELQQQQQQQPESSLLLCPYTAYKRYTARSSLVIFKGDLNFRRLVGDRHWDRHAFMSTLSSAERDALAASKLLLADTHVHNSYNNEKEDETKDEAISFHRIVSAFWPVHVVPVCAIRTIKSELSVGVTASLQDSLDRTDPSWRTSGNYGVILLAAGT